MKPCTMRRTVTSLKRRSNDGPGEQIYVVSADMASDKHELDSGLPHLYRGSLAYSTRSFDSVRAIIIVASTAYSR